MLCCLFWLGNEGPGRRTDEVEEVKEAGEEEEHQIELRGLPELIEFLVKYVTGPGGDPFPHADGEKGGAENEEVLHKSEEM